MSETEHAKKLFFQALSLMDSSNFQDAELQLREALRLVPGQAAILTNLSIALMQQHKRAEAREYAEQAIAIDPEPIEPLMVLADCDRHDDHAASALAAYDRILESDPAIAEIHNNRGVVCGRLGRHADAVESYDRALALNPDRADVHVNRGNALSRLGRHDEAFAAYDRALALAPDLAEAWLGRGNALCDVNRSEDALAAYDRTLASSQPLAHAWLGRGNALSQLKRYGEALTAYEQAIASKPDLAEAWLGCGNARRDLGRHDAALTAFDRALALLPTLAAAWLGRGNVFYDRKHFAEALTAYDGALALDRALVNAWVGRGHALRSLKRAPESIEAYRHALELGGDAESIRFYLAGLGGEPSPVASPKHFVANLFDAYAENFDRDLIENLKYRTPLLVADAVKRYASSSSGLDIVDLGCGTGLMGEHIRSIRRTLTGVDLSANMLEKARQRGVYDQLFCCDLTEFLQTRKKVFDLAVAADVFVYLGDLSPLFLAVRGSLRQGGLFCFSVEAADDGNFTLRSTLRYAHSIAYLRSLAEQHQFTVEMIEPQVIRREAGANIDGYLAVMRNSEPAQAFPVGATG